MANPEASKRTCELNPIGYVDQSDGVFQLKIHEAFRPALKQLDRFTHAHVLWWADRHDNADDRSVMQAELPYAPGEVAGVYACRAEYRPNPIAMTICFLVDVDEASGVVDVAWIDAFDGTPILDIKPYIPVSDRIRDVGVAPWLEDWPEWMEDAAEYFAEADLDLG